MNIADGLLTELISALRAAPDFRADQRSAPRTPVHVKVDVTPINGETVVQSYTAVTRDLSVNGLGLFQSCAVKKSQQLLITVPRDDGAPLILRCTVMHCRPLADGIFGVGMRIDHAMGENINSPSPDKSSRRPPVKRPPAESNRD